MSAEAFTGRASEMKASDWLSVEDIADIAPIKMTIAEVFLHRNVAFEAGRKEDKVYSLKFQGAHKQLVINGTNRKTLVKAYSNKTEEWRGKEVTLTIEPLKREFNGHRHGIRIKA